MTKRPKGAFWDASHNSKPKKAKLQEPLDLNPARDKDNAGRVPKPPTYAPGGGATNLAPRGAMGTRLERPAAPITPSKPMSVEITQGDPTKDFYIQGKITSMEGYRFTAKIYDLPSQFGIDGGKISKLQITQGDRIAADFDRGWTLEPKTTQDREALEKVRTVFDPPEREFKPIASKTHDKDHGHER